MNTLLSISATCILFISLNTHAQSDTSGNLPLDLPTETLLFLKFDSLELPSERPAGMSKDYFKKWSEHNKQVPKHNAKLRTALGRYPYPYSIVSMKDARNYASQGFRYMLWLNTFESVQQNSHASDIIGLSDAGNFCSSSVPNTQLLIIDMTSDKKYVVDKKFSAGFTYRYDKIMEPLLKMIQKEFGTKK